ncbi:MAG: radical SAM protein [Candidatus Woesearchaeota archaeon]
MDAETEKLIDKANQIFNQNFPATTWFERAVFYSWACKLNKCCTYCYMSTLPKEKRTMDKVRSFESLLAETLIVRELGWKYGFLSGGMNVFSDEKLFDLIKKTSIILNEKIWINVGILNKKQLKKFKPYIKGVVGTIEVLDPELHKKICPNKSIEPVRKMFQNSIELELENAMTLIVGLGETKKDFGLLQDFIKRYEVKKIHIYGLNPQKNTVFENSSGPTKEYQAWWIAKTRVAFPKIDIQCGIWEDKVKNLSILLRAGANSISKYPAIKQFNSKSAKQIEAESKKAGRKFLGSLTKIKNVNWDKKIDELKLEQDQKNKIRIKLGQYLKQMLKNH